MVEVEAKALEELFTALDLIDEALEDGPAINETPGEFKARALALTEDFQKALEALTDADIEGEYGESETD